MHTFVQERITYTECRRKQDTCVLKLFDYYICKQHNYLVKNRISYMLFKKMRKCVVLYFWEWKISTNSARSFRSHRLNHAWQKVLFVPIDAVVRIMEITFVGTIKILAHKRSSPRVSEAGNQHEAGKKHPASPSPALKMEATCSSETSVDTQRTTRRYIPEDDALHNDRCENLKS
jgi:hypothetical protein